MRTRLLVIVLFLVGMLAAGLGVPLAVADSNQQQQAMFTTRLTDTIFYASLAERPLVDADPTGLEAELQRYDQTIGVAVVVFDREMRPFAASRQPVPVLDAAGQQRVAVAAAGRPSETYPLFMPWNDQPMVLAEPVLVDTEVRGVIVTISSTGGLRGRELVNWLLIAAIAVLALAASVLVALPITRWILRPVRRLDEGTDRVAAAVLAGAAPEPIADNSGPPELRRLTRSFDRMAETVTQAYSAQRAFVADASHQLRNPLTALRLRLANLEGRVVPAAAEDHQAAVAEVERFTKLLDGLLALARAERTVPLTTIDVDSAVDVAVERWRVLADEEGIALTTRGSRGVAAIGPDGAIDTALDAILDNAFKFTPRGGAIEVATTATASAVTIAVRDSGSGMAPDELERATDRFWRAPEQSNVEGSGLGLAIAARTVEVGGGSLRLDLPPGGGLRVTTTLRRAAGSLTPQAPG